METSTLTGVTPAMYRETLKHLLWREKRYNELMAQRRARYSHTTWEDHYAVMEQLNREETEDAR